MLGIVEAILLFLFGCAEADGFIDQLEAEVGEDESRSSDGKSPHCLSSEAADEEALWVKNRDTESAPDSVEEVDRNGTYDVIDLIF